MSDYTMVLNGLRHCINLDGLEPNDTRIRCHGCPYFTEPTRCGGILMRDAAAAIEALQAELNSRTIYGYPVDKLIMFAEMCKRNDLAVRCEAIRKGEVQDGK